MRKIKFRGKRSDNGEFVFGDLVQWGGFGEGRICSWENGVIYDVDEDSIAQLVGYDKNNTEVYEGDTVVDEYGQKFIARLKVIGIQKTDADEFELAENLETGEIVNCRTGEIVKAGGGGNGGA